MHGIIAIHIYNGPFLLHPSTVRSNLVFIFSGISNSLQFMLDKIEFIMNYTNLPLVKLDQLISVLLV